MTVVSATLFIDGCIVSMPRPARHGDLIRTLNHRLGYVTLEQQDFLLSDKNFASHKETKIVARNANQVSELIGPILTSEDLW